MLVVDFPEDRLVELLLRGHFCENLNLRIQRLEFF